MMSLSYDIGYPLSWMFQGKYIDYRHEHHTISTGDDSHKITSRTAVSIHSCKLANQIMAPTFSAPYNLPHLVKVVISYSIS